MFLSFMMGTEMTEMLLFSLDCKSIIEIPQTKAPQETVNPDYIGKGHSDFTLMHINHNVPEKKKNYSSYGQVSI